MSVIIGGGITAIGGALFFLDAYNDMGHPTGTFSEALLSLSWKAIWWPTVLVGNSKIGIAAMLIVTVLFWAGMAYGFIEGNKKAKTLPQIPRG